MFLSKRAASFMKQTVSRRIQDMAGNLLVATNLPVFKAIDDIEITTSQGTGGLVVLQGPSLFCGGVLNFTITKNAAVGHGNGWITVAVVRYNPQTVKAVGGLESFNNRDVIAFRTYQVSEVYNRDLGTSYFTSNMAFSLRTRNHRKVNEQEGVCVWIKGHGNCYEIKFVGDFVYYYKT